MSGGELARRLLADGHEVYGLRRRAHLLPGGVQPVAGDLCGIPTACGRLPGGLDVLCYAAAADGRSAAAYRAAYVDGVRNVLHAVGRTSALRRVLYTSSTRVYPQSGGEWVDENSPTGDGDPYARLLLEGEAAVRETAATAVVLRLAGIYGPGRTRLIDRVRAGEPCSEAYTNRIHRDDCAGVLRHLMQLDRRAAAVSGSRPRAGDAVRGDGLVRQAAGATRAAPHRPPKRAGSGKRCRNARLVASGFAFEYPGFRDGYEGMIADLSG